MPIFPSIEWCQALVESLEVEPDIAAVAREWGGKSIGVVIAADAGLKEDFCVFAKPHATKVEMEELRSCEDEDDLELDEPDFLFKLPYSLALKLLQRRVEPLDVLRKGQVRVEGDLKELLMFSQKHQALGERAIERLMTAQGRSTGSD